FEYRGRCLFCDIVDQELAAEKRVVVDVPGFLAFTPFAGRFPFETWIIPKQHASHFENASREELAELASVVKTVLLKLETALDKPAYNYLVHTAPLTAAPLPHYHWHLEVIPRLTRVAGFEWGAGFYINPVYPETAAQYLRDTDVDVHAGWR
ncbi:MAG: HIT domain-containing protein, partial [Gemmataceae bacterium]|nr:HIT domain-containing protein [Gemmataceae bacterium]